MCSALLCFSRAGLLRVRWPGRIPPGQESDHVWAHWDFLPRAAAIAGVTPPAGLDGLSMLPARVGERAPSHEFLYWELHERGFHQVVRMGDWKAVRHGLDQPLELYDLRTDRSEQDNVAPAHPAVVTRIENY